MEDFSLDLVNGTGPMARSIRIPLKRFTLIGATTRAGMLSSPLRDRFGMSLRLEMYTDEQLKRIIARSAKILGMLGLFVKNSNMLNGLSNIVSLGMCFLSGVFVPMSVMDKKVLKIAQFLPVYWYEDINETLARYHSVSGNIATDIWKSLGIEVMFALAFVSVILALSKYKRQK